MFSHLLRGKMRARYVLDISTNVMGYKVTRGLGFTPIPKCAVN